MKQTRLRAHVYTDGKRERERDRGQRERERPHLLGTNKMDACPLGVLANEYC